MFDDNIIDFQSFREECLKIAQNKNDAIIQAFLSETNYKGTVGYYRDSLNHVMEIYAKYPGQLIGRGGLHVLDFQKTLSEEFGGKWSVKFIEVRGGFVNAK